MSSKHPRPGRLYAWSCTRTRPPRHPAFDEPLHERASSPGPTSVSPTPEATQTSCASRRRQGTRTGAFWRPPGRLSGRSSRSLGAAHNTLSRQPDHHLRAYLWQGRLNTACSLFACEHMGNGTGDGARATGAGGPISPAANCRQTFLSWSRQKTFGTPPNHGSYRVVAHRQWVGPETRRLQMYHHLLLCVVFIQNARIESSELYWIA
jgi:hypothetical protein